MMMGGRGMQGPWQGGMGWRGAHGHVSSSQRLRKLHPFQQEARVYCLLV